MATTPLRLAVDSYSGSKPELRAKYVRKLDAARRIEEYVNAEMRSVPSRTFTNYEIAEAVNLDQDSVSELLMRHDGGSNGITVSNPKVIPAE